MIPARSLVFAKYDGRCAYCGNNLSTQSFHVDHRDAVRRTGRPRESYTLDELEPACTRCNLWKGGMTVEEFREAITAQPDRLARDVAGFRLARDFRVIEMTGCQVRFYFERRAEGGE